MRQTKVVIRLEHYQLLPHAILPLAERGDTTPYGRHPLPDVQVEPLDKGRIDLPATGRQHLLDGLKGSEHHAVAHADETPTPYGLTTCAYSNWGRGIQRGLGDGPLSWRRGGCTQCP